MIDLYTSATSNADNASIRLEHPQHGRLALQCDPATADMVKSAQGMLTQ